MKDKAFSIGVDCGSATIKAAVLVDGAVAKTRTVRHHGDVTQAAQKLLTELAQAWPQAPVVLTGSMGGRLQENCPSLAALDEIPALQQGIALLAPEARALIEVGSQSARFLTGLGRGTPPRFAVNEHCAGGTGSFFEDQMSRLGLALEDYAAHVAKAQSIPRLSGRCAVFAKTDIIHRQQEGVPVEDILLGLCYAMVRNYKAVIVRSLPVEKPLALAGGVGHNPGVLQAVRAVFALDEEDLLLPPHFDHVGAVGAALAAQTLTTCSIQALALSLSHLPPAAPLPSLPPLLLPEGLRLADPETSGTIPPQGCMLGIDIGSTSTDLVLVAPDGSLIDLQYLRTAGDPEAAVRQGLENIRRRYGEVPFLAVGVTGSGRARIGRLIGADVVRDEITAQARAATAWVPEADTVFEIGGQDSKYISLRDGKVVDFQMNKICAAGTGSFVEEQAARMGISLADFGALALKAEAPAALGERCTVFIETAIQTALARGASAADVSAGLCHSIVRNYLHKVVANKTVGNCVVLQGGVAYNPGIVAAFSQVLGKRLHVSPCFSISGAYGAALLALEAAEGPSRFHGFDTSAGEETALPPAVQQNIAFYEKTGALLLAGYDPTPVSGKKTVGVPFALMLHKFFPMANTFFKNLGFNVLLSPASNEEIIRLAQNTAQAETCYPVKLLHGHMAWLAEQNVDYIFIPQIHTMRHETSRVEHNYGCVYMQTAPLLAARALKLEERGITLLSPVFDLDFGKEAMASAMLTLGKVLDIPKPRLLPALMAGAMAVRKHTAAVEKQGKALLEGLAPDEKVLVLITRNYGLSDPVLNMGIPRLLLEHGHKVITLSHLPAHDLDIAQDHPNLYWPFGQHIVSGAKLVAHHPNLYAVYLTNHGCGPDTMLQTLFRQEMAGKPYLQIEVDEHFSPVGVITRIEAFLHSLENRPTLPLAPDFSLTDVRTQQPSVTATPHPDGGPLYLPEMAPFTPCLCNYATQAWQLETRVLPLDAEALRLGRSETTSKEYLPYAMLLGATLAAAERESRPFQVLVPNTQGAEADGQYAWAISAVLARRGLSHVTLVAPQLETLPQTLPEPERFFRALLTADLLLCAPPEARAQLAPQNIPDAKALRQLAAEIGALSAGTRRLGLVGEPLTLFALNGGLPAQLEREGWALSRAPLSEYLLMLWQDAGINVPVDWRELCSDLAFHLHARSSFAGDHQNLRALADQTLPRFAGAGGRYRLAKACALAQTTRGVISLAPRYENTATVLEMTGAAANLPHLTLALDDDQDDTVQAKLRAFLYYLS